MEPSEILTEDDIVKERTPDELAQWVDDICKKFTTTKKSKLYAILRQGLAKKFYEEIRPLSIYLKKLYSGHSEIKCVPNLGSENYDAIIYDHSQSPTKSWKVETTLAIDGYDQHLRRKVMIEKGGVFLTGKVTHAGTEKTGHTIDIKPEATNHFTRLQNELSLIKKGAAGKAGKEYGKNHVLLIAFDDYIYITSSAFEKDIEALKSFTSTELATLDLDFGLLYIIGLHKIIFLPVILADSL